VPDELIDQRVTRYRQPPHQLFQALQESQLLRGGERVKRQPTEAVEVGVERLEDLVDVPTVTRMFEYYVGAPTKIPTHKPLEHKWGK
jgi:hypothetical protein